MQVQQDTRSTFSTEIQVMQNFIYTKTEEAATQLFIKQSFKKQFDHDTNNTH